MRTRTVLMFCIGLFSGLFLISGCNKTEAEKGGFSEKAVTGTWEVTRKVFIADGQTADDKKCGTDEIVFVPDMAFRRESCAGHSNGNWSLAKVGEENYLSMNYGGGKDIDFPESLRVMSFGDDKMILLGKVIPKPVKRPDYYFEVRMEMKKNPDM